MNIQQFLAFASNPPQALLTQAALPEIIRDTPATRSAGDSRVPLTEAAVKRANELAPDNGLSYDIKFIQPYPNDSPEGRQKNLQMAAQNMYAGHVTPDFKGHIPDALAQRLNIDRTSDADLIFMNPNSDAAMLAHELGHGVSAKTKAGKAIRNVRNTMHGNPKLIGAVTLAGMLGAGANAVIQEGDDDMATSLALGYAGYAPMLVDEALATKNALAIMKDAGQPATMRQRAKLAGAFGTYATLPLGLSVIPNLVGNQFDSSGATEAIYV